MVKTVKTLSERIAERAAIKQPTRGGQNRAKFLALRAEIQGALDDGWPVKTIWETLHDEGKVSFSYQAFRGYVNRLIFAFQPGQAAQEGSERNEGQGTENLSPPPKTGVQAPSATASKAPAATGFAFQAKPNKQELL